jgi:dihydrofolate synthase/folylpolyglutamate synthase
MDVEARDVIIQTCEEKNVPYLFAEEVSTEELRLLRLPPYQIENAKNAVAAIRLLEEEFDIISGLKKARWPGRMDVISKNPFILLDGAHNPQGVYALKKSLDTLYPDEKFTFIFGVLADKDYASMIQTILPLATRFLTVTVDSERALNAEELAKTIESYGVEACEYDKISEAISGAKKFPEKIVIFGSLYFIGEVLELFREK